MCFFDVFLKKKSQETEQEQGKLCLFESSFAMQKTKEKIEEKWKKKMRQKEK